MVTKKPFSLALTHYYNCLERKFSFEHHPHHNHGNVFTLFLILLITYFGDFNSLLCSPKGEHKVATLSVRPYCIWTLTVILEISLTSYLIGSLLVVRDNDDYSNKFTFGHNCPAFAMPLFTNYAYIYFFLRGNLKKLFRIIYIFTSVGLEILRIKLFNFTMQGFSWQNIFTVALFNKLVNGFVHTQQ
jgi:hypothetical protein